MKVSDAKLLETLLTHGSVSETAVVLKISKTTIYKKLQDSDFRTKYNRLQGVTISAAACAMSAALDAAVATLVEVMRDKTTNAATRVQAAHALLSHCSRYTEDSSILERLDALEAQTDTKN